MQNIHDFNTRYQIIFEKSGIKGSQMLQINTPVTKIYNQLFIDAGQNHRCGCETGGDWYGAGIPGAG